MKDWAISFMAAAALIATIIMLVKVMVICLGR